MSMSDNVSDLSPIVMKRLADETGLIITGDFVTFGSTNTCVRRSATTCRARMMSVPFSKIITIDDRPGIDVDRISSTHGVPLSMSASRGVVIIASTSSADKPERLALNLHVRPRELRQDVDGLRLELREAEHQQQCRERGHDESKP